MKILKLCLLGALVGIVALAPQAHAGWSNIADHEPVRRITLADQTNVASNGNTATWYDVSAWEEATLYINTSSWDCTSPCSGGQIQLEIQSSPDGGSNGFREGGTQVSISSTGVYEPTVRHNGPLGEMWRVKWTLTSTPTASFTVKAILKNRN